MSQRVLKFVVMRQCGKWAKIGVVCLAALFTGCGPQADLALKFSPGDRTKYKIVTEDIKDFKFEQPSLGKARSEPRSTTAQIKFVQEIESVGENGDCVAEITIRGLKYLAKDKDGVKFDFDSDREGDRKKPLAKLLGNSYKIKLASDGGVQVLDAKKIRRTVSGGQDGRVAKALLSDEGIRKRHEILFLPDSEKNLLYKGDSWSRIEATEQRLMVPKTFEKTYTLKDVKGQVGSQKAVVEMTATETATPPGTVSRISGGIGLFANMFDTEEDYNGEMVLDLDTGKVVEYYEKFVTKYIAAEPSARQKPDKGPDLLTIILTYSTTMEMLD
ncbi:MAG TPA: hypothetical protein HPP87_01925 [Planctomycetes bacterium]|nr:hypothetical protein [Planctomycetota bacterium]HIJ70105.1 hypothetical protein [Planctomycetota bacterium]